MWKSLEEAKDRSEKNLIDAVDCHILGTCYWHLVCCIFLLAWIPFCAIIWLVTTAILAFRKPKQ